MPRKGLLHRLIFILGLFSGPLLTTACSGGGAGNGSAQFPTLGSSARQRSQPTSTPTQTATSTVTQARSSDAFVDFIGVDAAYDYPGSVYDTTNAEIALENLGVRHVRSGASDDSSSNALKHYRALFSHGVRLNAIWDINAAPASSWNPLPDVFATEVGLSNLDSYEGANEPNTSCSGHSSWVPTVTDMQSSLYNFMQGHGLSSLPLLAPALGLCNTWASYIADANALGNMNAVSNIANVHAYPSAENLPEQGCWTAAQCPSTNGRNSMQQVIGIENPGRPVEISETGYQATGSSVDGAVGPVGQERYTLRLLLNFWNQSIDRVYLFSLLDDFAANGTYYGLMNDSYTAKPAYTALKNLLATLSDPGAPFSAGTLNYTLGGALTNVNQVLLEKRNGTFEVILWQAVASVNSNGNPLTVAPQAVTLTLSSAPTSIAAQTFTNAGALTPVTVTQAGGVASVPVNDIPVIISLKP